MNDPSPSIAAPDAACAERVGRYLDTLTKPPGSLGRLEDLAVTLAGLTGEDFPGVTPPAVVVFAADHGVAEEGVSAFPQAVTAQMVANFVAGGAAINVFSRRIGARLEVVDVGVASELPAHGIVRDRVRPGTANLAREDAMSRDEALAAIAVGRRAARRVQAAGCRCLIAGEMGIANTTASSAMLAALTGAPVSELVGAGTGVAGDTLAHKRAVIEAALLERAPDRDDPLEVLARLGGLEIAAMAGAFLEAASHRLPILVDGFIATVAALTACRLEPALRPYLIFGHRSHEPGHRLALEALGAEPLLDLALRLGEGSGAVLAFPLLEATTAMLAEMATFATAGVDDREAR
ncbi:nicotinate-nucleotide--dimethylbenzimidazole phosphoribosyltransferase [Halomonas saccharevitans]|uniref:Nicotinate-nucleotide--dimethylbenzimidazole phosphoribosyltransferase n=1 Tax=Halomonas saccharevitans TaxID=416872 RepID=A0A1I7ALZ0_9GAMM|nr:nicotinate-nucleotide--dimethylbenzimidazole phosphoribosyltransferase [Halomonas saccharevitans]MDT8880791.1 nicotinate-nucleotide--dimethylbenzimidazole phosphoribosyltransferase [Halomonas saccharevitans]SFT75968.1 nicotinate-nucleotide-dimethylbenzimidazole phosphoribosyltransferase [Halomonas saccharevitans]